MNYKALAAGAVLGFLMAVAPACGGGEEKCGTNNCAGCCGADGKCVETGTQTVQACGSSGIACVACAANQTCNNGACTAVTNPKPDGGTSSCAQTCAGCCITTATGSEICLPGSETTNCGSAGSACQQCTTSQICSNTGSGNACNTPGAGLGSACTDVSACSTLGAGAECRTTTADSTIQYAGGYCTKGCASNADCGDAGFCGPIGFNLPDGGFDPLYEDDAICMSYCSATTGEGCRAGYTCVLIAQSTAVCILDPAAPDNKMGAPCTDEAQCAFPPNTGFCISGTSADGGPSGWPGGACSADCFGKPAGYCGSTAVCVGWSATEAYCFDKCSTPDQGRGDCRQDWTCYGLGGSTDGVCFPACDTPGNGCNTGSTCDTVTGYCVATDAGTP